MQRFFCAEAPLLVGDSSLVGVYRCDYCHEPFAQLGRFQILVSNDDCTQFVPGKGNFCTPECAAGHNTYKSRDAGSDACKNRHALLERRYGRRIACAPMPRVLRSGTVRRAAWLTQCREQLEHEERIVAERELYVEKLDLCDARQFVKQ